MKKLIESVLAEKQITKKVNNELFGFYENDGAEFYFFLEIPLEQLVAIKTYTDFENNASYKLFKTEYDKILKEETYTAIEKNSSLTILVKGQEANDIEKYQQQILLLEEDEYFFKKYVIVYLEEAVASIKSLQTEGGIEALQNLICNVSKFDQYSNYGFIQNISDYLLALQLFVKLPFLSLEFNEEDFHTLQEKLDQNLGGKRRKLFATILQEHDNILELDFKSKDSKADINDLLKLFVDD